MRVFSAIVGFFLLLGGIGIYAYYDNVIKPEKEAKELLIEGKVAFENAHKNRDKLSNALNILAKVIGKYPDTDAAVEAYFYIGYGYEKLGLKRLAYLKYIYALKNNAKRSRSWVNQIRNYDANYDMVEEEIRARIAKITMMKSYSMEGIHQLLDVIGRSSNNNFRSRGYAELGHEYLRRRSTRNAKKMFDLALREDGDNEEAILGKASASYKLGHYSSAFNMYEQFFRNYSAYSPYYRDVKNSYIKKVYWRGVSSFKRKKFRSAISYFKRLLRTFPNSSKSEKAKFYIAESYLAQKKYSTALNYYDKTLMNQSSSKDQEALFKKGYTYFMAKRYDLAAREFQKYINTYPGGKYLSRAKKWKEECKKEILYRLQMKKVPDMDYDIEELEEEEGIEEDYKKYKKLKKEEKKKPTYKYKEVEKKDSDDVPLDEDDKDSLEELEEGGLLKKVGKLKNYFKNNRKNNTNNRIKKNKKDIEVEGKIKKYVDKLVEKENVAEL